MSGSRLSAEASSTTTCGWWWTGTCAPGAWLCPLPAAWSTCSHNAYGVTWLHTATWLHSATWLQYWMVHLQSQCIWCHMVTHCHLITHCHMITILKGPPAVTMHTVPHGYTLPLDYNTERSTCSHNTYNATWLHTATWLHSAMWLVDYNTEWFTCSHNTYSATWLHTATWLHSATWLQY